MISFRVDMRTGKVDDFVRGIANELPKEMSEAGLEFLRTVARTMRSVLIRDGRKGIAPHLINNITVEKRSKYRSELMMPKSGAWLDNMRPHKVQLKRGRNIHKWAMKKGNEGVKKIAARQGMIKVRPHPFIDESFDRSITRMDTIIKRHLNKAVK